jgi:hypothetical protein
MASSRATSDVIGPAVGAHRDVVAATMVAAMDQHLAHAGFAYLPERYLLRAGHYEPFC